MCLFSKVVISLLFAILSRFVPDKGFQGSDPSARREGPVKFTQDEEEDPFGLNAFLKVAKNAPKRPTEDSRSRDSKRPRK